MEACDFRFVVAVGHGTVCVMYIVIRRQIGGRECVMIDEQYSGGVFSKLLDNGRAGADITLTATGVAARVSDGQSFDVPYRECQIEVGGHNGRMVFCRDAQRTVTIFCEDRKFPRALSIASSGRLDEQLAAAQKRVRSQSRRGTLIGIISLFVIGVLIVGGYFALRYGARASVHYLPISVDQQIGETAFATMDLGGTEVTDQVVVDSIQAMVDRLKPHAAIDGLEFEVHVIDADQMNAFCLPGGVIVIYTGLISAAENPEQVAAVLGHEMSHATLRHGMERTSQSLGMWAAISVLIGDASGLIAGGAELFQIAVVNSYSRGQEDAADAEGVRMLDQAGINPIALANFFKIMKHKEVELPGMFAWISTHPQHSDRITSVTETISGLPQREYTPMDVPWQEVQDILKNLRADKPEP